MIKSLQKTLRYVFISIGMAITLSIGALSGFVAFKNEQIILWINQGHNIVNHEVDNVKNVFSQTINNLNSLINNKLANTTSIQKQIDDFGRSLDEFKNKGIDVNTLETAFNLVKDIPNNLSSFSNDIQVEFNKIISEFSLNVDAVFQKSINWVSTIGKSIAEIIFWTIVSIVCIYFVLSVFVWASNNKKQIKDK